MNLQTMDKLLFSRRCIKGVSLLNVCLHLNLALAPAFFPLVASAQEIKTTKPYVLTRGETATSVAAKFGLSVSELQKLNQLRTFATGFSSIGEGSEIDIPVRTSGTEPAPVADTSSEVLAATLASQAGSFLQNDPSGDDAVNLARGLATDRVSQEVQAWLGKKGTAKVSLNTDEKLSLKGSSLDVLYALSETQNDIFFTQAGIRDADDRTQANFGLGIRHFAPSYMLGGNLFYDHDLSRDHNRLGIGAEYWRDYFKMGVNAYLGLSGWKDSPDLDDYEERSANGWDIRAEGYLPAYPQLGGKLTFEQYYGDNVGLFGNSEDDLQKDPYAVTAGVIYTPVPLVSLNADYKTGKGGEDEATFGVNVNYSLGVPFKDQLNSHAVTHQRTLMGSRYDLVDRNNNIVLEYRKKEVIKLRTAPLVTGLSGERKSLDVSVTAKHGLQEIRWQADSLLAKGGRIVHDGGEDYSVILPPYSADGNNNFLISGIAYDKKGNASSPSETQISVQRAQVSKAKSQFTPAQSYLPADGKATQMLTLLIRDEQNNPVTVSIEQLSLLTDRTAVQGNGKGADASQEEAVVSAFRETAPGNYEVSVKAGVITENITLTPVAEGITLTPAKVSVGGKPAVNDLTITGALEVGKKLDGTYTFNASGGEPTDKSTFKWGHKGETAGSVGAGTEVTTSGTVAAYTLVAADAGEVMELSVQAKNGAAVTGNTITVDSTMTPGEGNGTDGGDGGGLVINPAAAPQVADINITGTLEVGKKLDGTYTFNASGGEPTDKSTFKWGHKGETAGSVGAGTEVTTSGTVAAYTLVAADAGEVMELSVQAKNGAAVTGNTITADTTDAVEIPVLAIILDKQKVKKGETIKLTVEARFKSGDPVVGESVTVSTVSASNRQKVDKPVTATVNGTNSFSGVTDSNGQLIVDVQDNTTLGLETIISAVVDGHSESEIQKEVIFTVLTSPDTPLANYWGHMTETVSEGGVTFERPKLNAELAGTGTIDVNNETWARFTYTAALTVCPNLAPVEELEAVGQRYAPVDKSLGWPAPTVPNPQGYRTSTPDDQITFPGHWNVDMDSGVRGDNRDSNDSFVACKR